MGHKYPVSLISDSTRETLDRIFHTLKFQFFNFDYKKNFFFIRTKNQVDKIIKINEGKNNSIILYTIVETKLAKHISFKCSQRYIPYFSILGDSILGFSKTPNKKATHIPNAQHIQDENYYKRSEAIQLSMDHDDGMKTEDIENADIILLGVSRTNKTPISIYLANRGYKTLNIPLAGSQDVPIILKEKLDRLCVIGLSVEAERLSAIRANRLETMKDKENSRYSNLEFIKKEIENSKKMFKKYNWPVIHVTKRSVKEIAASINEFLI